MNKIPAILLSLLGLGVLCIIVYYAVLFWAFKDFGMPPWPDSLYETQFDGHEERVEQTLLETYKTENLKVEYRNGNYFDLNVLYTLYNADSITFEYSVYYCKPIKNWVNYGWAGNCNQSKIALYRILINDSLAFDFGDDKNNYPGIKQYINIFETVLVNKIKTNINKYPLYTWTKEYTKDSSEVIVFVVSENHSDTIAKNKFEWRNSYDSYVHIYTELYFGDSIIRYDYDGHYITSKSIVLPDHSVIKEY